MILDSDRWVKWSNTACWSGVSENFSFQSVSECEMNTLWGKTKQYALLSASFVFPVSWAPFGWSQFGSHWVWVSDLAHPHTFFQTSQLSYTTFFISRLELFFLLMWITMLGIVFLWHHSAICHFPPIQKPLANFFFFGTFICAHRITSKGDTHCRLKIFFFFTHNDLHQMCISGTWSLDVLPVHSAAH